MWADLRRRVFAYILNKFKIFSKVNEEQLEVSLWSTSVLALRDLDLDTEKLSVMGIKFEKCNLKSFRAELGTTGIKIKARGLSADVRVEPGVDPMVLTTILNNTEADLANLTEEAQVDMSDSSSDVYGSIDLNEVSNSEGYGPGDVSTVISRLADLALAQLAIDVEDVTLHIQLADLVISATIKSFHLSPARRFTVKNIVVEGSGEVLSEAKALDSKTGSAEADTIMEESIYFDIEENTLLVAEAERILLGTVDWMEFVYVLPSTASSFEIGTICLELLPTLEAAVSLASLLFPTDPRAENQCSKPKPSVIIHETQINTKFTTIFIKNTGYRDNELTINDVSFPGIHLFSPFLHIEFADQLKISVPHPISIEVNEQQFERIQIEVLSVTNILSKLKTRTDEPVIPFALSLSDIRISISGVVMLLVPAKLSENSVRFEMVSITTEFGNLIIQNLEAKFAPALNFAIDTLHVKLFKDVDPLPAWRSMTSKFANIPSISGNEGKPSGCQELLDALASCRVENIVVDAFGIQVTGTLSTRPNPFVSLISFKYAKEQVQLNGRAQFEAGHLKIKANLVLPASSFSGILSYGSREDGEAAHIRFPALDVRLDLTLQILSEYKPSIALEMNLPFKGVVGNKCRLESAQVAAWIVDGEIRSPVGQLTDVVVLQTSEKIGISVRHAVFALCADSSEILADIVAQMVPKTAVPEFKTEIDPLNPMEDVHVTAFDLTRQSDSPTSSYLIKLGSTVESIIMQNEDHMETAAMNVQEHAVSEVFEEIHICDDYLGRAREVPEWAGGPAPRGTQSNTTFDLRIGKILVRLHDGYDLIETRQKLQAAVSRIESEARVVQSIHIEEEEPFVGNLLYNSIYIGVRTEAPESLKDQLASSIGTSNLSRSKEPKVEAIFRKVQLQHEKGGPSTFVLKKLEILDRSPSSKIDTILVRDHNRDSGSSHDLCVSAWQHDEPPELQFKVDVAPMRLRLDQDTLDFMIRFAKFDTRPDAGHPPAAATAPAAPSPVPFIRQFAISDVAFCIDYVARKVDYSGLRSGYAAELMNLLGLERAKIVLKRCVLYGVSGYDRLWLELVRQWGPDIRANQLASLLAGVGPVRRVIKLSSDLKSIAMSPVQEARPDGSASPGPGGFRAGAMILARKTGYRFARISGQLAGNTQQWLTQMEDRLAYDRRAQQGQPAAEPERGHNS